MAHTYTVVLNYVRRLYVRKYNTYHSTCIHNGHVGKYLEPAYVYKKDVMI